MTSLQDSNTLPEYQLTWIPEGCTIVQEISTATMYAALYEAEETGNGFTFAYSCQFHDDDTIGIFTPSEAEIQTVSIHGASGDLYLPSDPSVAKELIWFDKTNQVWFHISSYLETTVMLHIGRVCNFGESYKFIVFKIPVSKFPLAERCYKQKRILGNGERGVLPDRLYTLTVSGTIDGAHFPRSPAPIAAGNSTI